MPGCHTRQEREQHGGGATAGRRLHPPGRKLRGAEVEVVVVDGALGGEAHGGPSGLRTQSRQGRAHEMSTSSKYGIVVQQPMIPTMLKASSKSCQPPRPTHTHALPATP
jgi:hypothetical protein